MRDNVCIFKKGLNLWYRYGDAGCAKSYLHGLSRDDQKRFLYWALVEEDSDIKNVAQHFLEKLEIASKNASELLMQMNQHTPDPWVNAEVFGQIAHVARNTDLTF